MGLLAKMTPSALSTLCFMIFWGQIQNYMMRVNLAILIVAMVDPSADNADNVAAATELAVNETCAAGKVSCTGYGNQHTQLLFCYFTHVKYT